MELSGMKPRLVVVFLLIVLLPLGLLSWLGFRVARFEREEVRRKFQALLLRQLTDFDQDIALFMEKRQRDLLNLTDVPAADANTLRDITRNHPFVRQAFLLDARGGILHPAPSSQLSASEWAFLGRAKEILIDKNLITQTERDFDNLIISNTAVQQSLGKGMRPSGQQRFQSLDQTNQPSPAQQINTPSIQGKKTLSPPKTHGWYIWFQGKGIQLLFWRIDSRGNIVGVELDKSRLLADVIGLLPETVPAAEPLAFESRVVLANALDETLYQWGSHEPPAGQKPLVEKSVGYPLSAWKLKYFLPPDHLRSAGESGMVFSLIAGLTAAAAALVGLSIYFYRESSRDMREASQRVSFVNQVSHELKTPLTNIRLYAELLENSLADEDEKTQKRLEVIGSESRRLSRLIGNILSFGRKRRSKLTLRMAAGSVDEVILSVLDHFKASFSANDIEIEFDAGASQRVRLDPDALEQILGNLFSNVEKYAASGKSLKVESRFENGKTVITVSDRGPGIPARQRERIFDPFHRVSNRLTDGVSGTGIGLTIARDLARLHGGDLEALAPAKGAAFRLALSTPLWNPHSAQGEGGKVRSASLL